MPELPEVETMRRGILSAVGSRIVRAEAIKCKCRPIAISPNAKRFAKLAQGRTIAAIDRLGKRVVVRLDDSSVLIFEPRMTGLVLTYDAPSTEHLRFRLDLQDGPIETIWYWDRRGLGSVHLLTAEECTKLEHEKLGPDALAISAETLRERMMKIRRAVKPALLEQKLIAGIGNLYASEILHRAKVHPEIRCDEISKSKWEAIHAAMREVLELAIRYEGSTLSDGTYRNALNKAGGYQNEHRVYDREGEACRTCRRGTIERIVQTQRSTFFCPRCQKK